MGFSLQASKIPKSPNLFQSLKIQPKPWNPKKRASPPRNPKSRRLRICFKASESSQNRAKRFQNPPPDPSKTAPKRQIILQTPKINNNATLLRFAHFSHSQPLENRPKIGPKTPSKSALSWMPSWDAKKYDF